MLSLGKTCMRLLRLRAWLRVYSAMREGGKARGLPSGVFLQDLVASKTEAIPPTHDDGNPDIGCEFFETRQVQASPSFPGPEGTR